MKEDFLQPDELAALNLAAVGHDVRVSRHALLFGAERISIGDGSRIDAFCIISVGDNVSIGRNVHISAYASIQGRGAVTIGDFASVSIRCTILSSNDDMSGDGMVNPTIPDRYRGAVHAPVIVGEYVSVGAGCIILPGVTLGESAAVGAHSLVKSDVDPFTIVAGIPARLIGPRRRGHRALAEQFLLEDGRT